MSSAIDITNGGGGQTIPLTITGAALQILTGPGRLQKVLVTVTTAAVLTFYDGAGSGPTNGTTIVGVIPSGTTAGTVFSFNMPVVNGIYAAGGVGAGAVTISF